MPACTLGEFPDPVTVQVKAVTIFRDPRSGASKGCGLAMMASRAQAEAALAALDQKLHLEVPHHTICWNGSCRARKSCQS